MKFRSSPFTKGLAAIVVAGFLGLGLSGVAIASEEESDGKAPVFVAIDPLHVSIIENSRVAGFLAVTLSLEPASAAEAADIERLMPRLLDQFNIKLAALARTRISISRPINIDLLSLVLQRAVDEQLGKDRAAVLIQSATLQPL